MNSTKNNTARISSKFSSLDFDLVYEFCRALPPIPDVGSSNDLKPQFYNIIDAPVPESLRYNLRLFKKQLMDLIRSIPVVFNPAFIELSLYDPRDRSGSIFYSILFAENEDAITCYRNQMEGNLERNINLKMGGRSKRGPIIPNKLLHESVFYSLPANLLKESANQIKFNAMGDELKAIFAGSYNTSNKLFTNKKEDLDYHIENFLKDVSKNCMKHLRISNGDYEFNFATLLPLFRPAARFKGEREIIYNGGGIFLYGHLQDPQNENEFILALQTLLTKSIFKASHSQIHFDEVDAFKNIFTAMIIHQIKNKLTNQITRSIERLIDQNHLQSDVKSSLRGIQSSSENIVNKFTDYLNNVGYKLSQTSIPEIDFNKFESIIDQLRSDFNLELKIENIGSGTNPFLKANEDILKAILEQVIENAIRYYADYSMDTKTEKVIFRWKEDIASNIIQVSITSTNSKMNAKTLEVYGLYPIKDTGSTGLGGLFINSILEQIEAKRFDDGRHFKPSNEKEGFCLTINFNLHNRKNGN